MLLDSFMVNFWWLSKILWYLHCISNGDTTVMHKATDMFMRCLSVLKNCSRMPLWYSRICHNITLSTMMTMEAQMSNIKLTKDTHSISSPSRVSYWMSFVRIWEKADSVIMALHCTQFAGSLLGCLKSFSIVLWFIYFILLIWAEVMDIDFLALGLIITHLPLVPHTCIWVDGSGQHCFR